MYRMSMFFINRLILCAGFSVSMYSPPKYIIDSRQSQSQLVISPAASSNVHVHSMQYDEEQVLTNIEQHDQALTRNEINTVISQVRNVAKDISALSKRIAEQEHVAFLLYLVVSVGHTSAMLFLGALNLCGCLPTNRVLQVMLGFIVSVLFVHFTTFLIVSPLDKIVSQYITDSWFTLDFRCASAQRVEDLHAAVSKQTIALCLLLQRHNVSMSSVNFCTNP